MGDRAFPAGFVFGVATAAYQVEGHIENDWSEWERAGKLKEAEARCGRAVDHWNRHEEDYRLARAVGSEAFRISLEWARIEPRRGHFDENALASYRERLLKMRAAGLRPVVTLHHFTHPTWFHKETPWHSPESVAAFRRYARICAEVLRDLDAIVLTFNEPMVLLLGGYMKGLIPPGIADGVCAMQALANIARSHVAAREELTAALGKVTIGTSQNCVWFAPDRSWNPLDRALVLLGSYNYNHAFIEALITGTLHINMPGSAAIRTRIDGAKDSIDFIGINYYTRAHLRFVRKKPFFEMFYRDPLKRGLTDIGWEQYPEGFGHILLEMNRYKLPIWITENGIDDRRGTQRSQYLYQHWSQILDAVAKGVDVRGYLYWSLMDNFEWLEAWGPRFGLYWVDFDTLERRATPACHYFRHTALTRKLSPPNEGRPSPKPLRESGLVLAAS